MEAWSKVEAGFVQPVVIARDTFGLRIVDVETHPVVYKVWRQGRSCDTCFLLENRQRKGFDALLPGSGLLIWHIDPYYSAYHNRVDLEEDSTNHLDRGNGVRPDPHVYHEALGDTSDPLPGIWNRTSFDNWSNPSSRARNGQPTWVSVRNIREVGDTIVCDVSFDSSQVGVEEPERRVPGLRVEPGISRSGFRVEVEGGGPVAVAVFSSDGRRVWSGVVPERGWWKGVDSQGRRVGSGVYLVRAGSLTRRVVLER